uniref:Mab-21-like HhH/H2TH-like domain-containing protein n=1 Tax=Mola mola TaxID=94237 RepID=A0A3Q3WUW9_MOLML
MQGAIARVCVVVAAAILNHPLFFTQENTTLPDQDDKLIARMRDQEERMKMEQAKLEKEFSQLDSKQKKTSSEEEEEDYSWYFWSTVSFVIFFTIEMCRLDLSNMEIRPVEDEDVISVGGSISPRTIELDKDVLSNFCEKCTYTSSREIWRVREFVEGFVDDLLESLRSVCDREADVEVWDFIGIGSMFESWKVCKPLTCDLVVPFSLPDPFSFQFHLWCSASSNVPPNMQGCGKIKVSRPGENEGCLCDSADQGEDMLCLLHSWKDTQEVDHSPEDLLCSRNKPFLSKYQVMKWFQISITKAWGQICHKYDFEVTFRNLDAAGALKIRFRSGKVVSTPDPYWPLSFAVYERNLLKHCAKRLPQHSCHLHCLQTVTLLHRKQTGLTGKTALTNYHIKTVLLHLLLSIRPSMWGINSMEHRLRDMLCFLQRSLEEKRLHHILIGNSKVPGNFQVPEIIRKAEPINLLRSLVLQRELHADTVRHFQEMLRNAPFLLSFQIYIPINHFITVDPVHISLQ